MSEHRSTIKAWAEDDRPRERALQHGLAALSTAELFAILIGSGSSKENAVELMRRILGNYHDRLSELSRASIQELCRFNGIGEVKALTIAAACELGRRRKDEDGEGERRLVITSSAEAYRYMRPRLCDQPTEECWVLLLNPKNVLIEARMVSKGGQTNTVVDVREVMREALHYRAAALILVHNHPSGHPQPSPADDALTAEVAAAAAMMKIPLADHLIVASTGFYSYADQNRLR
jgi:DNA repair protein RadC